MLGAPQVAAGSWRCTLINGNGTQVLSQADGVTSTPALITIRGMLNEGDDGFFRKTLGTIRLAIVLLDSPVALATREHTAFIYPFR